MHIIEVERLQYTYPGASAETLHGLDFKVEEAEIVGFLGPSGAGKSTTQKILIGLLKNYRGRVQVLQKEVSAWGSDFYEHIGVSFELPNHHQRLTALENLELFGALYAKKRRDPMELLERVHLAGDANKRVMDFSKGMKIRLNVARSLLNSPRVLFLDEPTSGLDPVNAQHVKDLVLELREQGTTIVLTTHDMMVADQLCDRVAFITSGEIREFENPQTLKQRHGRRVVRVDYRERGDVGSAPLQHEEFALDGLGENRAFFDLLTGVMIERIHTQETTLEQVFIDVTGEQLRGNS